MPIDIESLIFEIRASELFENRREIKWFFNNFDEKTPCNVLEVGSANEDILFVLSRLGYKCDGVDLQCYNRPFHLNYNHFMADFNLMASLFANFFDVVVSISTLEHFGLSNNIENYDVLAVQNIWNSLKPSGVFYVTVPFGKDYRLAYANPSCPVWRVYNSESLKNRVIQKFEILLQSFIVVEPFKQFCVGREITEAEASTFTDYANPAIMVGLKMRKT